MRGSGSDHSEVGVFTRAPLFYFVNCIKGTSITAKREQVQLYNTFMNIHQMEREEKAAYDKFTTGALCFLKIKGLFLV